MGLNFYKINSSCSSTHGCSAQQHEAQVVIRGKLLYKDLNYLDCSLQ